jgi:hypothetical protein
LGEVVNGRDIPFSVRETLIKFSLSIESIGKVASV